MEAKHIYCLFCVVGKEESVVRMLEKRGQSKAIFPRKVKPLWHKDAWEETLTPLFPGYVFVYAQEALDGMELKQVDHVLRPLRYGEDGTCELQGDDLAFAKMMLETKGVLGSLNAIEEGSYVRITDGLLSAYQGKVLKVDKRKRIAEVELELLGSTKRVWLSYTILETHVE